MRYVNTRVMGAHSGSKGDGMVTEPRGDETDHMHEVDAQGPWGSTEGDEMDVLRSLYAYDTETGTFSSHVGDDA